MPQPRLDDATIEYTFSVEEATMAKVLDPLKIAWYQTRYAQLWKQKNSTPMPEESSLDRSFMLRMAEIEGKMNAIQEILDDHRNAMISYNEAKLSGDPLKATGAADIQAIAHSAGSQVHQT